MRKLHKKPLVLAAAAIALTGSLTVGSAMAYFTTYATAGGGVKMNMGFTTTVPDEKIDEKGKHVTIINKGDYELFRQSRKAFSHLVGTGRIWHRMVDGRLVMTDTGIMKVSFRQVKRRSRS